MDSPPPKTSPNRAATFPLYRRISQYAVPHFDANKLYREQICLVLDRIYWLQTRFFRGRASMKGRQKLVWAGPRPQLVPLTKPAEMRPYVALQ